jgi:hypothetical protein
MVAITKGPALGDLDWLFRYQKITGAEMVANVMNE